MLAEKDQISLIKDRAGPEANTLVLIFTEGLGGFEANLRSTPRLTHCGEYECKGCAGASPAARRSASH
jgi:hypothetical protein